MTAPLKDMSLGSPAGLSRRRFVEIMACGLALGEAVIAHAVGRGAGDPFFGTRGVVLSVDDLTLADWPGRASAAGLTTIALHAPRSPHALASYVQSKPGRQFLSACRRQGLAVEYELHAMQELLPREYFDRAPKLFRMDETGRRVRDWNLCVHSAPAMQIAADNAVALAQTLRPTTGRYFYWGDDSRPWCRCPECAGLSDSDQALRVANRILEALRKVDAKAQVAHLAYDNTLPPPRQVKPQPGIFLEYAPIHRRYDVPFEQAADARSRREFEMLEANLEVFGRANAQVLEYWLDASRFSQWKKPAVEVSLNPQVLATDLDMYGRRGIRHVTTFGVYLDAEYVSRHGEPPLKEYGDQLRRWSPPR